MYTNQDVQHTIQYYQNQLTPNTNLSEMITVLINEGDIDSLYQLHQSNKQIKSELDRMENLQYIANLYKVNMVENNIKSFNVLYRYITDRNKVDQLYNTILKKMTMHKWNQFIDYYPFHSLYSYDDFKKFQKIALYRLIFHEPWISFYEKLINNVNDMIISRHNEDDYNKNIFVFGPQGEDVIFNY